MARRGRIRVQGWGASAELRETDGGIRLGNEGVIGVKLAFEGEDWEGVHGDGQYVRGVGLAKHHHGEVAMAGRVEVGWEEGRGRSRGSFGSRMKTGETRSSDEGSGMF